MRFWRKKPRLAPLLTDAEMKRLHEEIFEEPVSVERLFRIFDAVPGANSRDHEWVMDQHMLNRIRGLCSPSGYYVLPPPEAMDRLIGLPIAIEPFANLAIRQRAVAV